MKILTLKKVLLISAFLGLILVLVTILSITMGSVKVEPHRSISILLQSILGLKGPGTETEKTIILSLRVPRALLAGLVGAGLSLSGAIFQALLRNPLADPYILGVSSGAAVGAIVAILMGLGTLSFGLPLASFIGGLLTILIVFYFGRQEGKIHPNTLLLAGVIVSSSLSALIMFFLSMIASQAGWVVAEVGRQPWAIQGLLPVTVARSNLTTGTVLTTFILFLVLFTALLIAEVNIMMKQISIGPEEN